MAQNLESLTLREDAAFAKGVCSLDAVAGIVRNVKILGYTSLNGYEYDKAAVHEAIPLYENAKVNLDHPAGEGDPYPKPRRTGDRFGVLRGIEEREDGLYAAEFKFNTKHSFADSFIWWVENDPTALGFSHVARGTSETVAGKTRVTKIKSLKSVDLVPDPATTRSLFEMQDPGSEILRDPQSYEDKGPDDLTIKIAELLSSIVRDPKLSYDEICEKVTKALELLEGKEPVEESDMADKPDEKLDPTPAAKPVPTDEKSAMEQLRASDDPAVRVLLESIDKRRVIEQRELTLAECRELCIKGRLPVEAITEVFVNTLANTEPDSRLSLIEDRRKLLGNGSKKPTSSTPGNETPEDKYKMFQETVLGVKV